MIRTRTERFWVHFGMMALTAMLAFPSHADPIPPGWTGENVEVLGYTIMGGRPAFKISMTRPVLSGVLSASTK